MAQPNVPAPDEIRKIASATLHATLLRAANGTLRRNEAQNCAALMEAYLDWSAASECGELVAKAAEIVSLARVIGKQAETHIGEIRELLASTKAKSRRRRPAAK
ncbi:MAG TPA: hypothetical protein VIX83_03230 [Candidatus Cybelea sp.]